MSTPKQKKAKGAKRNGISYARANELAQLFTERADEWVKCADRDRDLKQPMREHRCRARAAIWAEAAIEVRLAIGQ